MDAVKLSLKTTRMQGEKREELVTILTPPPHNSRHLLAIPKSHLLPVILRTRNQRKESRKKGSHLLQTRRRKERQVKMAEGKGKEAVEGDGEGEEEGEEEEEGEGEGEEEEEEGAVIKEVEERGERERVKEEHLVPPRNGPMPYQR